MLDWFFEEFLLWVAVALLGLCLMGLFAMLYAAANPPANQVAPGTTKHCVEGVMYLRSSGGFGSPNFTQMTDAAGKPITCESR